MHYQKSPFLGRQMLSLFSTINLAYIQEINIFENNYSNLRHLKKSNGLKFLRIARNGHQLTKTAEDKYFE